MYFWKVEGAPHSPKFVLVIQLKGVSVVLVSLEMFLEHGMARRARSHLAGHLHLALCPWCTPVLKSGVL